MKKYKSINQFKEDNQVLPINLQNEIMYQLEIAEQFVLDEISDIILLESKEDKEIILKDYPFIEESTPEIYSIIDCGEEKYINLIYVISSGEGVSIFSKQ